MMQHRSRRLLRPSTASVVGCALLLAAAWTSCDAGGGGTQLDGDDDGAGGAGGVVEPLPCGIDCATIQTDVCSEAVCDEASGQCTVMPVSDVECDDGQFCTVGDVCVEGTCTGQSMNDCGMSPESWKCQGVTCDEASAECTLTPLPEGTGCTASDLCIVDATCNANGLCTGPVNDCFFAAVPNACQVAVCNADSGSCEPVPGNNNLPCIDTLCSQGGSCSNGMCLGATTKDCTFVSDACNAGSCDDTTGACVQTPVNEAGSCDDQDGCTIGDSCSTGACLAGTAVATCTNDDGCCGPGCNSGNDNDCQSILLFGDDLPLSGWQPYRDALTAAGRQWDESNYDLPSSNLGSFPDAATLANYDTLIITAESYTDWPDADNLAVVTWMQEVGERNLLIIGKDILIDFYNQPVGNGEFELFALLGVTYSGSSAGTLIDGVTGVQSDPITDMFFSTPIRLSQDTNSSGDYADPLLGPATHIGIYTGPSGNGLNKSAMASYAPSYQVVWMGWNMHDGIAEKQQRNELMRNILEWFKQ